jgi:hypothetical protein
LNAFRIGLVVFAVIYTALLLGSEIRYSEDYVRNYLEDIKGEVPFGPVTFFGINTTLSHCIIWGIALIFVVSGALVAGEEGQGKKTIFYASQALMFFYLGLDERFRFHEELGVLLHREDAAILLTVGIVEGLLLIVLGDLHRMRVRALVFLVLGGAFFGLMTLADAYVPMPKWGHITIEDLSKLWGGIFLLLFALDLCVGHITDLKRRALAVR